jgi:hypothetical protein
MITTRKQLKALRGEFRKWIKAGQMVRRETYNMTSGNHPPEINLPPVPTELLAPNLTSREIDAVGADNSETKLRLSAATERALIRHRERQTRRAVLAKAMAQAEALNR